MRAWIGLAWLALIEDEHHFSMAVFRAVGKGFVIVCVIGRAKSQALKAVGWAGYGCLVRAIG
jgi:hypothetical protein